MTEDAALFAAVLANPEDSLPRLVLADWFDENGEELLGWALRSVPEIVPFLSGLARWDRSPAGTIWEYKDGKRVELWDVEYAAELLVRYRDQFPTPPKAPKTYHPEGGASLDPDAPLGPAAYLDRWKLARQQQVAALRERAAWKAGSRGVGLPEFSALTVDPEVFEFRCCLLHELVLRGHDAKTIPGAEQYQMAMKERGHPLGWLPHSLRPVEAGVHRFLPHFGTGIIDWGGVPLPILVPLSDDESAGRPQIVRETEPPRGSDAWAAVLGWTVESNGQLEAREFDLDRPTLASGLTTGWFRVLPMASLSFVSGSGLRVDRISTLNAFEHLFSAASTSSAYGQPGCGAYGRLHAWKSFGWLAGASAGVSPDTILERAERCNWFTFGGTGWFHEIAWDLALIALRPDGLSIAVLAATDTD